MADIIISIVIVLIVGFAIAYIIKEKKKGRKCIGCPAAGSCPHCTSHKKKAACSASVIEGYDKPGDLSSIKN